MALRPAGVHPVKHLGPVLGLGAARPGLEGEDGRGVVVLPRQQGGQPGGLHLLYQRIEAGFHLGDEGLILLLVAHFAQSDQIFPGAFPFGLGGDFVLQVADALLHLAGLFHVVPEAVCGGLSVELVQLPLRAVQIQRLAQLVQIGLEVVQLDPVLVKLQHIVLILPRPKPLIWLLQAQFTHYIKISAGCKEVDGKNRPRPELGRRRRAPAGPDYR